MVEKGIEPHPMKVILFGATGMIGQGVLRECLADPEVERVLCVVRTPLGQTHAKLTELLHKDFTDYSAVESQLTGYDACLFCLGISSVGMNEADYTKITYDYTLAAARTLLKVNPGITFNYVSGASTDGTAKGSVMWARVKGKTENDLLAMPFKGAYMFRPGFIQPLHGIKSKTPLYSAIYAVVGVFYPLLKHLPAFVTSTEQLGRAMIEVAKHGASKHVLESADINAVKTALATTRTADRTPRE